MDYLNRNFMIFSISELNQIDFTQVLETSQYTIRKSTDNLKSFVKWDGDIIPICVQNLTTSEGPYTYDEMISILETPEWMEYAPINIP